MYPCGYRSDPRRSCNCTPPQIEKYMGKISGPLMGRIDIHVEVPAAQFKELSSKKPGTSSESIRADVTIADLAGSADIQAHHMGEAINYRMLDRDAWQ